MGYKHNMEISHAFAKQKIRQEGNLQAPARAGHRFNELVFVTDDFGAFLFRAFFMEFHELGHVKLGLFQDLHLAHKAVLKGENTVASLFDFLANDFREKLEVQVLQVALARLFGHDRCHLFTDGTDLRGLRVARLLDLVRALLGESDAEEADRVAVRGLDIDKGFNERLPLLDQGADFVTRELHAVEPRHDVRALHIFAAKLDFAERLFFVLVQVGKADFKDASFQTFRSNLGTRCTVDQGLANRALLEDARDTNVIPVLAREGVNDLLLTALLPFGQSLVFAHSHDAI